MTTDQLLEFFTNYYIAMVVSMFVIFVIFEMIIPRTRHHEGLVFRWFTNLTMAASIMLIFNLGGPVLALFSAMLVGYMDFGLLKHLELSFFPALLAGIIILDLKQYLFHRMLHYSDFLWQVHRVHHSDVEIDLTTGFRFHPLEAILNGLVDIMVIMLLGVTAEVILLRHLLIYWVNFFTHANIHLSQGLDRYLKWILVTPSMHHLHHAMAKPAANHNFGVVFSFWDRMFGSFMANHPQAGSETVAGEYSYGLPEYRKSGKLNLLQLLLMPFQSATAEQNEISSREA